MRPGRYLTPLVLVLTLALTACGGDSSANPQPDVGSTLPAGDGSSTSGNTGAAAPTAIDSGSNGATATPPTTTTLDVPAAANPPAGDMMPAVDPTTAVTGDAPGASDNPATTAPDMPAPGNDTPRVDPESLAALTLHLAGDSTVSDYPAGSEQEGWGQELGQFMSSKVTIDNQALGGASVESFRTGSRWSGILSRLQAGDYVMIQFGANDSGTVEGRHVDVPDFANAYGEMSDEVKARQATTIFVTPSAFREWNGDQATNNRLGPYANALLDLGPTKDVLVNDLNARGVELLNMIGMAGAAPLYLGVDKAHFTKPGATQMAQFVADELRRIGSPLGDYVK